MSACLCVYVPYVSICQSVSLSLSLLKSRILLARNSLQEEKNNYKIKEKMMGNGKMFFRLQNLLEAISLQRKSFV